MNIRKCTDADLDIVKEITAICFDGVSIDQNIEKEFGPIAGHGWRWRKKRHIDADVDAHADGMFVAEVDGEVVGYITTRVDEEAKIGGIPNYAVLPRHQRKGIGLKLVETAIEHLKGEGMAYIRIETLEKRAALVPPPRFHLLRYHGVLAPRPRARERIVPAKPVAEPSAADGDASPASCGHRLRWATLLARVFSSDISECAACGGRLRIIAARTDPASIRTCLEGVGLPAMPPPRAPPEPLFEFAA